MFRNPLYARLLVTDLDTNPTTWLDKIHLGATITQNLDQPGTVEVSVRPNNSAANDLYTDGDPLLAQSNRLIYVFLREGGSPPWVCRAAGIAMQPQDQADADVPTSHFVFYDPWQYLMARPCFIDTGATLPGPDGFLYPATRGGVIVATLLKNTIVSEAVGAYIDAGLTYGGTSFWGGVIEDTPIIDFQVQQSMTVGQAWNELLAAGQDPDGGTGGIDIVLTPIYDPDNRPTYTHELSVYSLAGEARPSSPMAWGEFVRTSTTADRQHDASPGAFINSAYYYAGQGGAPVGLVDNPASITKYHPYWSQQFFPQQLSASAVRAFAQQAITLTKQGKRTFTVAPDPMRASPPFTGYNIGDRIPQLAPRSLRVAATGYQRVQSIPVEIAPDGATRVPALLTSPDWRGNDGT